MDFADKLRALAARAAHVEHLQTEEATKMALVVPFVAARRYDVYNPLEVIPEFTCDVGIKKGEKVDYAIMMAEQPIMLFECKKVGVDLERAQEEVEGYLVVKAIACQEVEPTRIVMRDTKSYCGVLLDDNNRKPICRLRFNGKQKKILGVFDLDKNEHKFEISTVDDIYQYRDAILAVVRGYHSSAA